VRHSSDSAGSMSPPRRSGGACWGIPFGVTLTFFAVFVLLTWGCPNATQARQVLEADGFTDIAVDKSGGHGWSCDRDASATKFKARRDAHVVEGVVCCGLVLTGCNIRITGGAP